MDLKRLNLNLLVHFDNLLNECSVSKAANKSHLSQAAMSGILKQLRELFDDPLFVREAHGLKPTPKALALMPKIKTFLTNANEIFTDDEFDPAIKIASFNFILGSHGQLLILSKLSSYLARHAPNFLLKTTLITDLIDLDKALANTVDIAIGADFLFHGPDIMKEFLLKEEMACAMRKSHPLARKELTQELFMEAQHVNIIYVEPAISAQWDDLGFTRNIKVTVSNLISALEVIRDTDYLAIVPRHLAIYLKDKQGIEIKPLPFPKHYFTINILYHKRYINHKPLQWLITVIKEHCL